ncbi:ATP-dependent DNA helicase PIF1-like protein, partial [Tanacetum coccineum]
RLYLSSTSSSLIIDDEKIPVLRRLKTDDSAVEYPVLRYRLELEISDDTAEVVVVLFDETATSLLKCSAAQWWPLKEKLEDSDAKKSFIADSQPKGDDMGCSFDTRKKRRVVLEDSE